MRSSWDALFHQFSASKERLLRFRRLLGVLALRDEPQRSTQADLTGTLDLGFDLVAMISELLIHERAAHAHEAVVVQPLLPIRGDAFLSLIERVAGLHREVQQCCTTILDSLHRLPDPAGKVLEVVAGRVWRTLVHA